MAVTTAKKSDAKDAGQVKANKEKKKKAKAKRVAWGVRNAEGTLTEPLKGKVVPDWNPKVHLPLRKSDFENPSDFLEWQADGLEAKVARIRQRAKEERELGSVADRQKARKLKSYAEKFAALQKEMEASGFDTEALLADIQK